MSSSSAAPIRALSCLILLALVSACERTPPPEAPAATATTPEKIPVASAPAPTLAMTPASVLLPFSTDDARIATQVGKRSLGSGMASTGQEGWLIFGPYIPLPAGHYRVELQGSVYKGHAGMIRRAAELIDRVSHA